MDAQNINSNIRHFLVVGVFILFCIIVFGLLWLFFLAPSNPSGFGWYLFSFAAGLSMIVLPCTLPLAFVIVPLSMGKGVVKGLGIAVSFGLGVALILSAYGILAAIVGRVAINSLGAPLEIVKNWVYFIAGIFTLIFALSEIGLLKFRMPTYTGAAPAFIQKKQDFLKAFLLGMFLGNIGVGCPHPATPLIFIEIATSGNIFYGWSLFFIHALGRVLPLLFLAFLGILGVNGLSWLVARKDKVERATGWAMVFVAGFILTLGLFSHGWWVNSGIHTQLEKITQEETLLHLINKQIGTTTTHHHGIETGTGLFDLPLWLGNWVLVFLWVWPLWWWWSKEKKRVRSIPLENKVSEKEQETKNLRMRSKFYLAVSLLLALVFIYVLPHNFLQHDALADHHDHAATPASHTDTMTNTAMMSGSHMHAPSVYHEENDVAEGLTVNLETGAQRFAKDASSLQFFVNEKPAGTPVDDLDLEHEKYMHVIGVRDDLSQFFHIHPEKVSSGTWKVDYSFAEPGTYKVWSDVTHDGTTYSFGHPTFTVDLPVKKGAKPTPIPVSSVSGPIEFAKNTVLGNYQIGITYPEPMVMARDTHIDFTIKGVTGQDVTLEPYLGVMAHLAVIKDDLKVYIHTHPEDHGAMGMKEDGHSHESFKLIPEVSAHGTEEETPAIPSSHISFNVNFPKAGIYKMFLQFRPQGINLPKDQSLVGAMYVKVLETGPAYPVVVAVAADDHSVKPPLSKPVLVFLSLVIMAILGRMVYKFIQIKPR